MCPHNAVEVARFYLLCKETQICLSKSEGITLKIHQTVFFCSSLSPGSIVVHFSQTSAINRHHHVYDQKERLKLIDFTKLK